MLGRGFRTYGEEFAEALSEPVAVRAADARLWTLGEGNPEPVDDAGEPDAERTRPVFILSDNGETLRAGVLVAAISGPSLRSREAHVDCQIGRSLSWS